MVSGTTRELNIHSCAAGYIHEILNGAEPAELPIAQPTTFEPMINLKARSNATQHLIAEERRFTVGSKQS